MKESEQSRAGWYFLLITAVLTIAVFLIKPDSITLTLNFFISIIKKIIPVFILVFIIMLLINYFVSPKKLARYFGKKAGIKGWLFSIIGGIISTGPIYMWYPMLNDMQKKGVKNKFIATFLYNRAVKPALLPLIIFYFGLIYTIVLTFVMIIASIFQGILTEKLMKIGGGKE